MLNSIKVPQGTAAINQILDGRYIPTTMIRESYLRQRYNEEKANQDNYTLYREYYDGEHETQLTERIKAFLNYKTGDTIDFNANYCPIVVDALAERLKVTGFDAGDQGELMWQWWRDNRMDGQQGVVHLGAVRDGDFFEMVEWDNEAGRPSFSFELACSNGDGVKVHYSKEKRNTIEFASKRWCIDEGSTTNKARRLNLYFADHIEKYIAEGSGTYEGNWRPYIEQDAEAGDGLVVARGEIRPGMFGDCGWYPWVGTDGKPLGVPVAHYKNSDEGYDRGQSALKNVIPLQNARNKALVDLLGASDASGFPMYTGTGDKFSGMTVSPGRFLWSEKADAKFGRLDAADLAPMIAVNDHFAIEIARVSRTPISYFQNGGQHPAEGTLQQEEVGLVAKAEKCTTDFGNAWEDLMKVARRLHNTFGTGDKLDETQAINAQWKPLQTRNELQFLQALTIKKGLGVSDDKIWHEMGYDDEEILEFTKAKLKAARIFASAAPAATNPPSNEPGQQAQGQPMPQQAGQTNGGNNGQIQGGISGRGAPGQPMMGMSKL